MRVCQNKKEPLKPSIIFQSKMRRINTSEKAPSFNDQRSHKFGDLSSPCARTTAIRFLQLGISLFNQQTKVIKQR